MSAYQQRQLVHKNLVPFKRVAKVLICLHFSRVLPVNEGSDGKLDFLSHWTDVFWFGSMLYVPGNSYGHRGRSVHLTTLFFLGKLEQAVNQYFVHILLLVTENSPS